MKNIFKIAAIALMACPLLMTACKDKEEEPTPEPTPDPTPTVTLNLTWNGEAQTLGFKDAYRSANYDNLYYLDVAKGINGDNTVELPEFILAFWDGGQNGMRLTDDFIFTDQDTQEQIAGNDAFPSEVFEAGELTVGAYTFGDYQLYGKNTQPTYQQFDPTTMTFGCNLDLKFFNLEDYLTAYQGLGLGEGEEPTQEQMTQVWGATTMKNLTLELANYAFSATK